MESNPQHDDELVFVSDDGDVSPVEEPVQRAAWRVLIVDDDPDVHTTTTFALRGTQVLGRPLQFMHANSAQEACAIFERDRDIAVVLLDVVMEQEDSGLQLVRRIREQYGMQETRVILRTGQPGYAPEMEAIRDYDINDYKTKSELTRNKLYTTLTSSIRSYDQIRTINAGRRGLDMVVHATSELLALSGIRDFAQGVITRASGFVRGKPDGLICICRPPELRDDSHDVVVIAAIGRYANVLNRPLTQLADAVARDALERCLREERHLFEPRGTALFFRSREGRNMAGWLDTQDIVEGDHRRLLELFCSNVSIGLDNTLLFSQLHNYAYFDALSQLPNRRSLIQKLDEYLGGAERGMHTLVLVDIDNFAETNDALGHYFGDLLLQAVAVRLQLALGRECVLARVSSDTFALLGRTEQLMPVSLQALFREPFVIESQELMVSVTMGIAHLTDIEGNGSDALKDANIALRRAKMGHRGEYSFFTRDMAVEIRERVKLLQALRQAMERQRLFLMYQPQIDLVSGKPCGIEALLRWRGDDGRMIEPDRFIPIAEHSGMIINIGEWVLRLACFQQVDLARRGFDKLRVAVNVSVSQFRHPRFIPSIVAALKDSGADPARMELEITESMALEEADFINRTLDDIKALGVKIAIDDFGTGFSSLSYLQRLRVDRLKIDRAFVTDIVGDERAGRIPELVIQLGQKLGLAVIAEGVETADQADLLRRMGCHEAQGYHFARPLETDALLDWLNHHSAASSK
ncbi:MAG: EAL domain-containing protein [Moraxellaceae bacterium]|nr:EAL domain-containing protein [Moraxellaceae bacterium]